MPTTGIGYTVKTVLVVWLLTPFIVQAQRIEGVVSDSLGLPIPFAAVYLQKAKRTTTANSQGHYTMQGIADDDDIVEFSHIGFSTVVQRVCVRKDSVIRLDATLSHQPISLSPALVTSGPIEQFLLSKVAQVPRLKKLIVSSEADVRSRIESLGNLHTYPTELIKILRVFMALSGYKKVFNSMTAHPNLDVSINNHATFRNGKIYLKGNTLAADSLLSAKEAAAFLKKKWKMGVNNFDWVYDIVRRIKKKSDALLRKGEKLDVKFTGSYSDAGRTVYKIAVGQIEIHIVEGCWQVFRYVFTEKSQRLFIQFKEIRDGMFLPTIVRDEHIFNIGSTPEKQWKWSQTITYDYTSVVPAQ